MYEVRRWFVFGSPVQEPAAEAHEGAPRNETVTVVCLGVIKAVDPSAQATIFTLRCVRCSVLLVLQHAPIERSYKLKMTMTSLASPG